MLLAICWAFPQDGEIVLAADSVLDAAAGSGEDERLLMPPPQLTCMWCLAFPNSDFHTRWTNVCNAQSEKYPGPRSTCFFSFDWFQSISMLRSIVPDKKKGRACMEGFATKMPFSVLPGGELGSGGGLFSVPWQRDNKSGKEYSCWVHCFIGYKSWGKWWHCFQPCWHIFFASWQPSFFHSAYIVSMMHVLVQSSISIRVIGWGLAPPPLCHLILQAAKAWPWF